MIGRLAILSFLTLSMLARASFAETPGFEWVDHPKDGTADLLYNSKPALRYMYAFDRSSKERTTETFKVYHHVFGPASGDRITNGPEGLYPHHRGLFVGWRRTKFDGGEIDSWHCIKGAYQRHVRFIEKFADADSGSMTSEITWDAPSGPVVNETRTVRVRPMDGNKPTGGWIIDWSSVLRSRRGKIELDGDRQHAGFQFRAAPSVAKENSATFIRPKGFPQTPKAVEVDDRKHPEQHNNIGWCAMVFPVEGKVYTVAYLEDPSLPKPSHFSERPYGRFGAFFKTTLDKAQPLTLRYRLLVFEGNPPGRDQLQNQYAKFVAELQHSRKQASVR